MSARKPLYVVRSPKWGTTKGQSPAMSDDRSSIVSRGVECFTRMRMHLRTDHVPLLNEPLLQRCDAGGGEMEHPTVCVLCRSVCLFDAHPIPPPRSEPENAALSTVSTGFLERGEGIPHHSRRTRYQQLRSLLQVSPCVPHPSKDWHEAVPNLITLESVPQVGPVARMRVVFSRSPHAYERPSGRWMRSSMENRVGIRW